VFRIRGSGSVPKCHWPQHWVRDSINIKNKLTPYQRTYVYTVLKWLVHMQILIVPCRVCIGIIVWSAMFTHGHIFIVLSLRWSNLRVIISIFVTRTALSIFHTIFRFFFLRNLFMVSICFHIHICTSKCTVPPYCINDLGSNFYGIMYCNKCFFKYVCNEPILLLFCTSAV